MILYERGMLPAINHFAQETDLDIKKMDTIPPVVKDVGFDIETSSLRPDGELKCFAVSDGESAVFVGVNDDKKRE